jgi:predicted cupin superfamily sugar epimerase
MAAAELSVEQIIHALGLEPLPIEGGLFRQAYCSREEIPSQALPERYRGATKPFSTAIFYLLTNQPDSFSEFHRLPTDEVFHFYLGDPLEVNLLYPSGEYRQVILGQDILAGQLLQFPVPAGVWQGSRVASGGRFSLIGTTMAPGYTPGDYEQGKRGDLLRQYPAAAPIIHLLTRLLP